MPLSRPPFSGRFFSSGDPQRKCISSPIFTKFQLLIDIQVLVKICSRKPSFMPKNQFWRPYFEDLGGTYLPKIFQVPPGGTLPLVIFLGTLIFSVYGSYVLDNVASCAFGIEADCQRNEDDVFVKHAKKVSMTDVGNPALILRGTWYLLLQGSQVYHTNVCGHEWLWLKSWARGDCNCAILLRGTAGMQNSMLPGCYGVLNDEIR